MSRQELRARNDQLLREYDAAVPGRRHHLAGRYGFSNIRCLYSTVDRIRKRRVAEATDRVSAQPPHQIREP